MDISFGRCGVGDVLVDEIETNLRKFVRVEDIQDTYSSLSDENSDETEESKELELCGPELGVTSLEKVACPGEDDPEAALQLLFCEGSAQSTVPLVSAMKGTREKLGLTPGKLTVKWAADVYDPVPNSLSHTVKSKQRKSRKDKDNNNHKKIGKKGQKSHSKGAGSKDRKQIRKTGGRSEKGYKALNTCNSMDSSDEFEVGSPDYCGSSFLKKSPSNFHYSVAEAL